MELVDLNDIRDTVGVEEVLDAVTGYVGTKDVRGLIVIGEDVEGTLTISCTDMSNTELVGTLAIVMQNYIHNFQHE